MSVNTTRTLKQAKLQQIYLILNLNATQLEVKNRSRRAKGPTLRIDKDKILRKMKNLIFLYKVFH